MAVSRMTEEIGRVLGNRYRIIAPIGRGASAQVFLADDVSLRRRVAVKMLHAALADDTDFLRRFRAEAQAAAALNHPHVMAVYDWGQDPAGDVPYLVLEYLAGGSLRALLDNGNRLTVSQALLVGLEATRALDAAHRQGFVHRDIKPANLLFGDDARLRIADFGLARALAEAAWTEPQGAVLGTARYASPEQAQGEQLSGKADVYSLALVLVEAVTGQVPFAADTTIGTLMARVDKPLVVPEELGALRSALERAGRADPDERLDAHGLGVALMAAAQDLEKPEPLPLAGAVGLGGVLDDPDPTSLAGMRRSVDDDDHDFDVPEFLGGPRSSDATLDLTDERPTTVVGGDPTVALGPPIPPLVRPDPVETPVPDDADMDYAAATAPRRPRWKRRIFVTLLILLLAGAGIAAGALVADLTATPTHAVPVVAGRDVGAVREQLAGLGWEIQQDGERRDGTEVRDVLSITPAPGTELEEGEAVRILVSEGQELANVPSGLRNRPRAEAELIIIERGLLVDTREEFDEEIGSDRVIRLGEGTRSRLEKGSTVTIIVSRGPEPRTVPNGLIGKPEGEVRAILEQLGLVVKTRGENREDVDEGLVLGSAPESGQQAARGSTITVVVSLGPKLVPVPDVRQVATPQEAAALIRAAGLVPGEVSGPIEGRPAATRPGVGTDVRLGTVVDIVLRAGGGDGGED